MRKMLSVLSVLFAGVVSVQAGLTNGLSALESELTSGVGSVATSMATIAVAALGIFGICFIIRVLKKIVRASA